MVYLLVPAHNNKHDVVEVLHCVAGQTYPDLKTILVDDGSTDGTEEEVCNRFPDVTILKGDGGLWWAGANALGVEHILRLAHSGDFILLLNNDVVVESNYVSELVECSKKAGRALVGSTIVDYYNSQDISAGIRLDDALKATVNRDATLIATTDCDLSVDVLPGRGTLVPVEVFGTVGNFNARRLPHYGADYEFCVRARRAGYQLAVSHRAIVHAKLHVTGIHLSDTSSLSLGDCGKILFSKRSSANLYYYLTYVWMCSEAPVRLRNTVRNGLGLLLETFGRTMAGEQLVSVLRQCVRGLRAGGKP